MRTDIGFTEFGDAWVHNGGRSNGYRSYGRGITGELRIAMANSDRRYHYGRDALRAVAVIDPAGRCVPGSFSGRPDDGGGGQLISAQNLHPRRWVEPATCTN